MCFMTNLLDQAVQALRVLPPEDQDDYARLILQLAMAEYEPPTTLTPEERAAIANPKTAAKRGEFATDDEARAVWAKHRL